MYTNIVVGTDGSDSASRAVRHAADLAKLAGARLHIVHVYQAVPALALIGPDGGAAIASADLGADAARYANEVIEQARQMAAAAGVDVQTHVCAGDPASALLDIAETVDADLVVVGNKGMSGVRRFVLGSVPNKVSHHCGTNLLVVHSS